MKKIIAMLLAVMMLASFAACGNKPAETPKEPAPASALEILQNVWAKYAETEQFPVAGGAGESMSFEGAAAVDMAANAEDLSYIVYVPADQIANIDGAATMVHAMNGNVFTSAALHMAEGADIQAFATALKDAILGTQFMCGNPEKLLVATIADEYVVVAFGLDSEEAKNITVFNTHLTEAYAGAQILFTETFA